jgi:hypothetical protein
MAGLPSVNVTAFIWYAVYTWSFKSQVVLHRPKEASNLPRWVGYASCIGMMGSALRIWSEGLKGREHLEDLGINGR